MAPRPSVHRGWVPRAALAVVVLSVGAFIGWWAAQQGGVSQATATATKGTVQEKVAELATVDEVSQADVNSDISGDVGMVDVQAGDYVYADETLATTDAYSADATLYEESLAINQDQVQLAADQTDLSIQSAEAELATVQQEVTTDQVAASQAQDDLATQQAKDQASLQQTEPTVSQAEQALAAAIAALEAAQAMLDQDQETLETAQEQFEDAGCPKPPAGSTADCTTLAKAETDAQSAVTADRETVSSAQSAVATAQQSLQSDQTNLFIVGLNAQSSLTQATAKLTTAELALSVADASLANAQAAVSQSQREVDLVTQVDAQRVTQVEALIQSQKDSLRNTQLTAPISGTVKSVQIKPGMPVTAAPSALTSASKPQSAAIVIDSHGSLVAETTVHGASAASIRVGDPVQLAFPQHRSLADGRVSSVGIISTDQTGAQSAPVTIVITGGPPGIYPGVTAEANITLVRRMHVLTVPSDAVHTSGTRTFVDELVNGRSVSHDVRVGLVGTDVTQILSGLPDGTQVVVPG
jgi:multidrug efflux pump subunit AcrA (membrane-fusion protein)